MISLERVARTMHCMQALAERETQEKGEEAWTSGLLIIWIAFWQSIFWVLNLLSFSFLPLIVFQLLFCHSYGIAASLRNFANIVGSKITLDTSILRKSNIIFWSFLCMGFLCQDLKTPCNEEVPNHQADMPSACAVQICKNLRSISAFFEQQWS